MKSHIGSKVNCEFICSHERHILLIVLPRVKVSDKFFDAFLSVLFDLLWLSLCADLGKIALYLWCRGNNFSALRANGNKRILNLHKISFPLAKVFHL